MFDKHHRRMMSWSDMIAANRCIEPFAIELIYFRECSGTPVILVKTGTVLIPYICFTALLLVNFQAHNTKSVDFRRGLH